MKIYILRHARTQANQDRVLQGRIDTPLSGEGVEQARAAAAEWKEIPLDCVYCSPLLRARQTAELVLGDRKIEKIIDGRLIERSFGEYEQRPIAQLLADGFDWHRSLRDEEYTLFGIEPLHSVKERVFSFLDELVEKDHESVLAVTHGAAAMLFYMYFHGGPIDWSRQRLENCQSVLFEI